ncbi:MAG: hypothetical protein D6681_14080 [Calditrichaeota bacterium]|nr:MAG: hypothetical protein D6681_14080 [Calditrichota bacterium]
MHRKAMVWAVLCLLLFVGGFSVSAQEYKSGDQLFMVHEDFVKPSMVAEYEAAIKGFQAALRQHGVTDFGYTTAMTGDFHYLHVQPIKNMAALDGNPLEGLEKSMGKEALQAMWAKFEGCYDVHKNYLVRLSENFSYNPENVTMSDEEMNFRHWDFYFINPDKAEEARAVAKEWRELHAQKKVPYGYRIYLGGLGTEMPLYVVVQWAKNAADFADRQARVNEMLGEEGKALGVKTMALTRKFEQKNGWMRPDLSYASPPPGSN